MKQKYGLYFMTRLAHQVKGQLAPYCDRIEIAGSVRREKPEVSDIEVLCIPKPAPLTLLGGADLDLLTGYLRQEVTTGKVWAKRPNERGAFTFGIQNKLLLYREIPIDVFSTDAKNWGMSLFVRTGPAEWNIKAMAAFKAAGMQGHAYGGVTGQDGKDINCPEEADVFKLLGIPYVEPSKRGDVFPRVAVH